MKATFVTVMVDEHDAIPDGCCMRFKSVDDARVVQRVLYDADGTAPSAPWTVEACEPEGVRGMAWAVTVEDSGAGVSTLVYGGAWGLRLQREGQTRAEPYLLLGSDALLGIE